MKAALVPVERIEHQILLIRGQKVPLGSQPAELHGVATGNLVRAMKRNIDRFAEDFMFQLSPEEFADLRCHVGTSSQRKCDGQFEGIFDTLHALMAPHDPQQQEDRIGFLSEEP